MTDRHLQKIYIFRVDLIIQGGADETQAQAPSTSRRYRCVCTGGAVLRSKGLMDSSRVGIVAEGAEVDSLEEAILMSNNVRRVKVQVNVDGKEATGWVSTTASDGTRILQPLWSGGVQMWLRSVVPLQLFDGAVRARVGDGPEGFPQGGPASGPAFSASCA